MTLVGRTPWSAGRPPGRPLLENSSRGTAPPASRLTARARMGQSNPHGTRQQAHPWIEAARRYAKRRGIGLCGVAGGGGEEDRGAHARGAHGQNPPGGGGGRPRVAAAVVRPHAVRPAQPGKEPGRRPGGGSGISRSSPAAGAAARGAVRAGASPRACRRRGRWHRRPGPARHLPGVEEKGTGVRITEKEVRYVAGLANLKLSDAEVVKFQADLDGIL